jgi:peptidoglycan/xylan/chitin deacetylase (PgdA/CDA1 family)
LAELRYKLLRTALEAFYFTGAHVMLRPLLAGVGSILMLHQVRPARPDRFQPNRLLEVTPQFLERTIRRLKKSGANFIGMDEVHRRMTEGDFPDRFVAVTLDDGYRDTFEHAYPILKKYDVPFAVYVATSFADRIGEMWWLALEAVIARNELVGIRIDNRDRWFDCSDVISKRATFDHIYDWLRQLNTEDELRHFMRELCARHRVDMTAICGELCMDWPQLVELAADPLVTIGAHTVNHVMLAKVTEPAVRSELQNSCTVIEAALGTRPQHLAYPVGDSTAAGPREFKVAADLGFKTAVTTRQGVVFRAHSKHMTALPRLSLNGNFQRSRYAKVLLSGAPTAMWNGFRPLNVT